MIDCKKTIHAQQACIGERRLVFPGRAAFGFQLVSEITDVTAGELERRGESTWMFLRARSRESRKGAGSVSLPVPIYENRLSSEMRELSSQNA